MAETSAEDYVYLDWAATTPLCEEAAQAMAPYLTPGVANISVNANANSLHTPGRAAFEALSRAHHDFSDLIDAGRPDSIIFTSGATEADNLAVRGIALGAAAARRLVPGSANPPRVIVSSIEHDAVLESARSLKRDGFDVVYVHPNRSGFIGVEQLAAALNDSTVLVSVMLANNEIGSVQDIASLCACTHEAGALMHTDAVQALGKLSLSIRGLDVDAASFSAHKVCGPKGVGALYLKPRTPLQAQILGGGQENGRRSGTQNVAGIVGFVAAAKACCACVVQERVRLSALRDKLYKSLTSLPGVEASVPLDRMGPEYLPTIVSVLVKGFESETLILRLDNAGFAVSGGSACASGSLDPSHVLSALGIERDKALGSLRLSIGATTTAEQLERFMQSFRALID